MLDGFRAMAILSVMCYHFYSADIYKEYHYPYGSRYDYFSQGFLGVQFFFMISGLVISSTLSQTGRFADFWKKRWIRLFPSMLVASVLIYVIFLFVKDVQLFPQAKRPVNLLTGLLFTKPIVINRLFLFNSGIKADYLNGSFWSLWPEIQFYILASVVYYFNQKKFLRNYVIVAIVLLLGNWLLGNTRGSNVFHIALPASVINHWVLPFQTIVSLPFHLAYFSAGVLFYQLYSNKQKHLPVTAFQQAALFFFIGYMLMMATGWDTRGWILLMLILFFLFIYYPKAVAFMGNKWLAATGVASYMIYLVHEPLGVTLVHLYAAGFGKFDFLFPVCIITGFIYLGVIYTKVIDHKISAVLRRFLLNEGA